jgi:hypothetical protein
MALSERGDSFAVDQCHFVLTTMESVVCDGESPHLSHIRASTRAVDNPGRKLDRHHRQHSTLNIQQLVVEAFGFQIMFSLFLNTNSEC